MDLFFEPRSLAVIGASMTRGKPGRVIIENLLENGYRGVIFPVNPKYRKILGLRAYRSVKDIPYKVDIAFIIVPAFLCVNAVRECAEKGIRAVVIVAGGFSEVDEDGARLQREIYKIANAHGVRIVGPNTSGIISTPGRLVATFFPLGKVPRGSISYVAQTGNFATHTMRWILTSENFGVSRVVGLGNKCDVDEADVLKYLGDDPNTKVVGIYMEGIRNGRRLLRVAKKVSRTKPVIALKSGITEAGARTALSHTASMASNDLIVDFAFRQAGILRLQSYEDLINVAKAFAFQPVPRGNRVGIMSPSGAMGAIMADACEKKGLRVPSLKESTIGKIQEISPKWLKINNPVDVWGPITLCGFERAYRVSMEALLADDRIDAVIPILMLVKEFPTKSLGFIPKLNLKHSQKPIMVTATGDEGLYKKAKRYLEAFRIPVYTPLEKAAEALAAMYRYRILNSG